jgi:hypothetical protein
MNDEQIRQLIVKIDHYHGNQLKHRTQHSIAKEVQTIRQHLQENQETTWTGTTKEMFIKFLKWEGTQREFSIANKISMRGLKEIINNHDARNASPEE